MRQTNIFFFSWLLKLKLKLKKMCKTGLKYLNGILTKQKTFQQKELLISRNSKIKVNWRVRFIAHRLSHKSKMIIFIKVSLINYRKKIYIYWKGHSILFSTRFMMFFFLPKKCAFYFKKMQFCICFLKTFRPLKR